MIQNYNAGITSYALWFSEFKLCLSMYQEGNTLDDIKQASDSTISLKCHHVIVLNEHHEI